MFDVSFINATFSTPCYEDATSSCSEVVNGTGTFDSVSGEVSDVSLSLAGSLTASLDGWYDGTGTNPCVVTSSFCLTPDLFYDLNALPADNPIEFSPTITVLDAPTPVALTGGADGTLLFISGLCGGDQANCRTEGDFPSGDFQLTSGTYTSVDVSNPSTPEPGTVFLALAGMAVTGVLRRRKATTREPSR